jgi:tetratricopeptide (TPR) repeat protein
MFQHVLFAVLLWQSPSTSFVEQSISSANESIAKEPDKPGGYNDLALALIRKQRETGDYTFLAKAEAAIQKSLKLEPANFDGRRARVALRLRQRRYEDALEEAEALRKQRPDDNPIYAYISEADLALGNYAGAEQAVQRMLDLRSVNSPGYEAGAMVRESIGFPDGALEWWSAALHLVSDRDHEERAHILSQMARVYRETGKYPQAVDSVQQAVSLVPGYPSALLEMARIRLDQQDTKGAVALLKAGRDLESLYWLDVAQGTNGEFERRAMAAADSPMNENALLVRYLAEHGKAEDAIRISEASLARRHDVRTLHAYAVALDRAGRTAEALEQIQKAMQPGLLDASLYFDAGLIAEDNHNPELAKGFLRRCFEISTSGPKSSEALKQLGLFEPAAAGRSANRQL